MRLVRPLLVAATSLGAVLLAGGADVSMETLRSRAQRALAAALVEEKAFIKVHAAEALIALGDRETPHRVFSAELPAANESRPYRIGVWRVLALASANAADRAAWTERIAAVVLDAATLDRIHAVESLGKLGYQASGAVLAAAESIAARGTEVDAVFARWVLHLAGDRTALPAIVAALGSADPPTRLRAAFVLGWLKISDPAARAAVARTANREPRDTVGYPIILGAATALEASAADLPKWTAALQEVALNGSAGARYHACQALMLRFNTTEVMRLAPGLDHPEGDGRIGAAWAILHVAQRAAATPNRR